MHQAEMWQTGHTLEGCCKTQGDVRGSKIGKEKVKAADSAAQRRDITTFMAYVPEAANAVKSIEK